MDGSSGRATGGAAAATTGRGGPDEALAGGGGGASIAAGRAADQVRCSPAGPMGSADRVCCTVPAGCWSQPPGGVPSRGPQRPAAADQIYDSVDALAHAMQTRLPTFAPWQRHDPSY